MKTIAEIETTWLRRAALVAVYFALPFVLLSVVLFFFLSLPWYLLRYIWDELLGVYEIMRRDVPEFYRFMRRQW